MRILLVDDDEGFAEMLMQVLAKQNYLVDLATDGKMGWEFVEAFTYDLILLDVLVHFVRPSADLLFESTASSYKDRAIAVVLTGTGSDGAMGVTAIKQMGGTVLVQDAKTAEFSGMPTAAIKTASADLILLLEEIPAALIELVGKGEHKWVVLKEIRILSN